MDGGTRVSVSQFKHQLLLLLGELLVDAHLPLQRHLHVLLLPGQLPGNIQQEEIRACLSAAGDRFSFHDWGIYQTTVLNLH